MPKTYFVETFGCQMNVHDSERMAGLLDAAGYEAAATANEADIVIINTCSVREHAEDKLYTRLGELRTLERETGRKPVVAVAGCVAQQEGSALLQNKNGRVIDVIIGTQRQKLLPMLVTGAESGCRTPVVDVGPSDDVTFPFGVAKPFDPVRAYTIIIEGCNDHCAFCVVPYTRGHERMRSKRDILADVQHAADSGRREVQLLGQIVNHYQAPDDPACDFAGLLEAVHEIQGIERIRFASPHPRHTGQRLIEAVRDLPKVCKHLHLPVQSGSTRVLRAMRRRYTRESYLELVARVREAIPGIALSTDMIVGFPGETPADFEDTLTLTAAAQYDSMFSFKYSPRPNTLASKRMPDDVPGDEKTRRIVRLQSLQREIQTQLHERAVGSIVDVLVDTVSEASGGTLSGRTSGNTVVQCPAPADTPAGRCADWLGRIVSVRVTRGGPHSLLGAMAAS